MTVTLANGGGVDRPETDFYPTPPEVTNALLDYLGLSLDTTIWEPACGRGHMARTMAERGYTVDASDILTGKDFLTSGNLAADWIITNPPFYLAEEFIRHAITLQPDGIALLLKSQYWHAAGRVKLFDEYPPAYVLPLGWRADFLWEKKMEKKARGEKTSGPTMEVLWTVWIAPYEASQKTEGTIYQPISRPCKITATGNSLKSQKEMEFLI